MTKVAAYSKRKHQPDKNYIGVTGKIFAVVEYFIQHGAKQESIAFQQIAASLPFARTTVHRIIYSLEKLGYLEKAEARSHYRLAAKFFEIAQPAVHFRLLQSAARSAMVKLLVEFGETVNLGVLEDGQVTHIDVLQSPSALRIAANPGNKNPLHSTALGKAILAFLPEHDIERILKARPLIKMSPKTITHKADLLEELARTRERGVAFDLEENLTGVECIGAPIFDQLGRVVASLSLSGPAIRMESKLSRVQEEVRDAAMAITRTLNPHPDLRAGLETAQSRMGSATQEEVLPLPANASPAD